MSSDVPDGWQTSTVGETAEILDSRRVPLNAEDRRTRSGPYPYWGANGIVDYIDDYIFDEPLVLMAEDGGYFDQAATRPICHRLDGPAWVNNHAHIIRPVGVDRDYFYYWFVHRDITPSIKGGTRAKLNQADLKRLPIWLPPLDEQRRIAGVLRSVDEAIAMNEAVAAQASRAYQAALAELIGSAPDHWETVRLSQIADLTLGKMLDKEKNKGELRPYLANINVRWGAFDLRDLRQMRFEQREFDRYGLRHGDIVMCEGGEPGRCALWTDEKPGLMIQKALHRIRPNERVDNHYLYYALVQSVRSGGCDEYMTGSGIKHLPGNQLAKIEVSLPSLDEQQRIAEALRLLEQAAAARQNALELARQIKSKLMSDLLSGHVRVPS